MSKNAAALTEKTLPDNVATLIDIILEENPMHTSFIDGALKHVSDEELATLDKYLDFCQSKGQNLPYMADSYLTIVGDTFKEQIYFMKHKEYRHKTYADVAGHVYDDEDYMNKYMYGLAITSFLWPNHLDMGRLFVETVPRDRGGKYLDIGPGHGYYLMKAMELGSFDEFLGIDISEASIKQTGAILDHFKPEFKDKFELRLMDFLDATELEAGSFDAIVMGEVLEHVEQPDVFLKRIAELSKDDGYIYITTCINAPAVDHIYLWRTTDELEKMIEGTGLKIKTPLRLPYEGKTLEESQEQDLSINVAYVLEKE
ncbi:MAG: class I SAM-dependent methyltransferase [Alphaproteobacteria bacterium]|nr:class I SAM-dependent methyltransferase [Alphaproteobacteria bacterium]